MHLFLYSSCSPQKSISLEKLNFFLGGEKLLHVNAVITSVIVFGFFRIMRSCLVWETALSWACDTGETNHYFNPSWAVSANRSDSSSDQCLDSWKCWSHLGRWLICFEDQWFYFFHYWVLEKDVQSGKIKENQHKSDHFALYFAPSVKMKKKVECPRLCYWARSEKTDFGMIFFFFK